ncbi:MAG: hypothetical protein NTU84_06165 [Verrucomicrobia bacterium]|jgi:hypothetical protein|nr:hypothetical protein [Verrucomicrobiota bacterium]
MNKSLLIGLLLVPLCLLPASAFAQNSPVQSTAPKLRKPPTRGAWVITYKSDKPKEAPTPSTGSEGGVMVNTAASASADEVKSRHYTVDGKLAKCVTHYSKGKTITGYIMNMIGIRERPDDPKDLVLDHLSSPYLVGSDFRTHFVGLEWVRPENYKGVVVIGEVRCHYFAEGPPPKALPSTTSIFSATDFSSLPGTGNREAWVTEDGLPRQTKEGAVTATYTFKSPDAVGTIDVPDKFRAVLQAYLDSLSPKDPAYSGNRR